jgi:hypothetical protein
VLRLATLEIFNKKDKIVHQHEIHVQNVRNFRELNITAKYSVKSMLSLVLCNLNDIGYCPLKMSV